MLKFLQNILSTSKPYFEKGGKLESLYPIYEAKPITKDNFTDPFVLFKSRTAVSLST